MSEVFWYLRNSLFHYSELSTLCHPAVVELKPSNDMMETIQLMPDHTGLVAQHQTINSGIYALVDPDIVNKKREMREQVQQGVHFRLRFFSWGTRANFSFLFFWVVRSGNIFGTHFDMDRHSKIWKEFYFSV